MPLEIKTAIDRDTVRVSLSDSFAPPLVWLTIASHDAILTTTLYATQARDLAAAILSAAAAAEESVLP